VRRPIRLHGEVRATDADYSAIATATPPDAIKLSAHTTSKLNQADLNQRPD